MIRRGTEQEEQQDDNGLDTEAAVAAGASVSVFHGEAHSEKVLIF